MIKEELLSLWQQNDINQFRKFGLTMAVVFVIISAYLWYTSSHLLVYSLSICIVIFVTGWFKPGFLKYAFYLWMSFALVLGSVMSRIILTLVYIALFMPAGIIMRIIRKDPLNRTIQTDKESYWIKKEKTFDPELVEKQY